MKAKFIGNQSKHSGYRLCNQHLIHNDMLKQNTCLLPVEVLLQLFVWFNMTTEQIMVQVIHEGPGST